jgi:hypothetical protein
MCFGWPDARRGGINGEGGGCVLCFKAKRERWGEGGSGLAACGGEGGRGSVGASGREGGGKRLGLARDRRCRTELVKSTLTATTVHVTIVVCVSPWITQAISTGYAARPSGQVLTRC